MPKNNAIHKVMVIGSGPIVIGQAAEFDYAGATAVACAMLLLAFALLLVINALQAWAARRAGQPR